MKNLSLSRITLAFALFVSGSMQAAAAAPVAPAAAAAAPAAPAAAATTPASTDVKPGFFANAWAKTKSGANTAWEKTKTTAADVKTSTVTGAQATATFAKNHYVFASALVVLGALAWEGGKFAYGKIKPMIQAKLAEKKSAKAKKN